MAMIGYEDEVPASVLRKAGETAEARQKLAEYLEVGRLARLELRERGVTVKVQNMRAVGRKKLE
jgi:hypothetical protein